MARAFPFFGRALCSLDCRIEDSIWTGRPSRLCDRPTRLLNFHVLINGLNQMRYLLHWVLKGIQQCAAPTLPI
jgi:hypothetical protein